MTPKLFLTDFLDVLSGKPPNGNAEDGSKVSDGLSKCPPDTLVTVIEGGNHAGFGHYGPQKFPKSDGKRSIALEEQHSRTIALLRDFVAGL